MTGAGRIVGEIDDDTGRGREQVGTRADHRQRHRAAIGQASDIDALRVRDAVRDQIADQRLDEGDIVAEAAALAGLIDETLRRRAGRENVPLMRQAVGEDSDEILLAGELCQPGAVRHTGGVAAAAVQHDDGGLRARGLRPLDQIGPLLPADAQAHARGVGLRPRCRQAWARRERQRGQDEGGDTSAPFAAHGPLLAGRLQLQRCG